jgi:hypothetical protein
VGGTISLRFGPMATALGGKDTEVSLHYLKQAVISYKPVPRLQLDFGKFDTIYGYELAEAQHNFNYTRGLVFWNLQPAFHAGFKASWAITGDWTLTGLVANGWDNTVDFNSGKSGGVQVAWIPTEGFNIALGYLFGPEQEDVTSVTCTPGTRYDSTTGQCEISTGAPGETVNVEVEGANSRFRHMVDLFLGYQPTSWFSLALNADFVAEATQDDNGQDTTQFAYGVMLAAQFRFLKYFAAALRGEYMGDPDGWASGRPDLDAFSATVTLEGRASKYLLARLESRIDFANQSLFRKDLSDWNNIQAVIILGVILSI